MPFRLSDVPTPAALALIEECRQKTARSYVDAAGQRRTLPMLKRSHAPRVDVKPVSERPGRYEVTFYGKKGKTPLVSFEAGSFGGSSGIRRLLDTREG